MKKKINFLRYPNLLLLLSVFLIYFSCCSSNQDATSKGKSSSAKKENVLTLSFSGDIMAHDTNYKMKDYNKIYDACRELLSNDDLSFGNIEMPVCDSLPLSTYPQFNVHSNYLKAAIDGGFDVFSFANNHTNDQKFVGMNGTLSSIKKLQKDYKSKKRNLYYCGIREKDSDEMNAVLIKKNGWKVLFLSITECLNSHDSSKKRVYYSAPNKKGRAALLKRIAKLRKDNPCDVFVLSLHLAEAEYGLKVLNAKKAWFEALAKAGIDIVWAQHPHVLQSWEVKKINYDEKHTKNAFFMYSMGNFISGQRVIVHYDKPAYYREYTGDSAIMQLKLTKKADKTIQMQAKPVLITNYRSKDGMVVKLFTKDWINSLKGREKKYFLKRFELMHKYLPF